MFACGSKLKSLPKMTAKKHEFEEKTVGQFSQNLGSFHLQNFLGWPLVKGLKKGGKMGANLQQEKAVIDITIFVSITIFVTII